MTHQQRHQRPKDQPTAPPAATPSAAPALTRSWWFAVLAVAVFVALTQTFGLISAWNYNPFARVPLEDGDAYWTWAGNIAQGQLLGTTPFFGAPLYPYLLGALRALGGGLLVTYFLQAALHVATTVLLAWCAARRFSPAVGLLSAILYALLQEPAFFTGRVLNCSLQLMLIVLLWLTLLAVQHRPTAGRWMLVGLLCGLNCLANPPMMLATLLVGLWAWALAGWKLRGLAHAVLLGAISLLVIAPAALHNYLVTREFIPLTAQAGVTFVQGNAPGSDGVYAPIAGISTTSKLQGPDALRVFRDATGTQGGWNAANRYYFAQGFDGWRSQPGAALKLLARKFYWFFAGGNYTDIYYPSLEISARLADWLRATPLRVAWLTVPAAVGLVALLRWPRRYGPELILFVIPLFVIVFFLSTPRYRLPGVPILAVLTAWVLVRAARVGAGWRWPVLGATAVLAGFALMAVNRATGFDQVEPRAAHFHHAAGRAWSKLGRTDEAIAEYRQAVALQPTYAAATAELGALLSQKGQSGTALEQLQRAIALDPNNPISYDQYGQALLKENRLADAIVQFRHAVALGPDRPNLRYNLGAALARQGDREGATENFKAAIAADPNYARAHLGLGRVLLDSGDRDGAIKALSEASRLDPKSVQTLVHLARAYWEKGARADAVITIHKARALAPDDKTVVDLYLYYSTNRPGEPADQP